MSSVNVYFITQAEDRDDACANVKSWLDESLSREFYDGFTVVEHDIHRVYELKPGYFGERKNIAQQEVARYKQKIEEWKAEGNTGMVGYCYVCIGHILMESFCHDMPFYNTYMQSWNEPNLDDWAVMVTLYY